MNKKWTEAEAEYIRANAGRMNDKVLAKKMTEIFGRNITLFSVRKKRQLLGVRKKPGRYTCEVDTAEFLVAEGGFTAEDVKTAIEALSRVLSVKAEEVNHENQVDNTGL